MGSFVGSGHVDREINSPCPLLKMLTSKESLAGIELSVCTPQHFPVDFKLFVVTVCCVFTQFSLKLIFVIKIIYFYDAT